MSRLTTTRPKGERGASAVEYALLVALIAAVIVAGLVLLGPTVYDLFDSVEGEF
jgi:pilus assembly protein Flp/PilA